MPARQSSSLGLGAAFCMTAALLLGTNCTVLSDVTLHAGFGQPCQNDADCQGSKCLPSTILGATDAGMCALSCTKSSECPDGTTCTGAICQVPSRVALTLPASVSLTAPKDIPTYLYTKAHMDAVAQAQKSLPYATFTQNFTLPGGNAVDALRALALENDIVIGHTQELLPNLNLLAGELPKRSFFAVNNGSYYQFLDRQTNLGTLWVRREQAWFIAGRLAGSSATKRIGIIAGEISPDTIRNINAFTLGARRENGSIKVEVRYIGFAADLGAAPTYDYKDVAGVVVPPKLYREELLARQLSDAGSEMIADMSSNQRALRLLSATVNPARMAAGQKIVPILVSGLKSGCTLDSGQPDKVSCLGTIYDNWDPIYQRAVEAAHRGRLATNSAVELELTNEADSPVGVAINSVYPNALDFDARIGTYINQMMLQRASKRAFGQQLTINGQRDADGNGLPDAQQQIPAGQGLSDGELAAMCFFVDGVVETYDTGMKDSMMRPILAERPAVVPGGLVPGASTANSEAPLPLPLDVLALPNGQSSNCRKNAAWIYRTNG